MDAPKDYQVNLDVFQGPLDLLLFLIRKKKIDIQDIPIAVITREYLEYLEKKEQINLEREAEFLLIAALLIYIKSQMLLPRETVQEDEQDPRQVLVIRLLEYQKIKAACTLLREKEEEEIPKWKRTSSPPLFKEADMERYFDILRRARERAGKDTVYDKRIAQIEAEMQPLKTFFADTRRVGPDFSASIADAPFKIDGNLDEPFWGAGTTWYPMKDLINGGTVPPEKSTRVAFRMTADKSALIIGVECNEPSMDKIVTKAKYQDDFDIFAGDVVEIYIETPERSYFKIAVDPNGKIWDETQDVTLVARDTLPTLWNPGTQAAVKKGPGGWTAEILVPTADFGAAGPSKEYPWGINVGRARFAEGDVPCYAISPTGRKLFRVLSRLGNLSMR